MEDQLKNRVTEILEEMGPDAVADEDNQPAVDDTKTKILEGRWFALGLFLVSIFLVSLAGVLPSEDRWFWAACAAVIAACAGALLIIAAWRWDRCKTQHRR